MNKSKIITIILLFAIIIALIAGAGIFILNKNNKLPDDAIGNTAGNLYNHGLFAESDDGYVYFANAYDNNALYRMLPDETNIKKLITTRTENINAAGKYVFYYQAGVGNGTGLGYMFNTTGIYKADAKNGENDKCIGMFKSDEMILYGNSIYYYTPSDGGDFTYKMDINGQKKQQIIPGKATLANIQNDMLYYTDGINDLYLKAFNLKNNSNSIILNEDIYMPIVDGINVYCIDVHNGYALTCFNLTTGEKRILDESRTDMLNITNSYIYYQTSGKEPQLKRVPKSGGFPEVVADGVYNNINVTSKYVYFQGYNAEIPVYRTPADGQIYVSTFDAASKAAMDSIKK